MIDRSSQRLIFSFDTTESDIHSRQTLKTSILSAALAMLDNIGNIGNFAWRCLNMPGLACIATCRKIYVELLDFWKIRNSGNFNAGANLYSIGRPIRMSDLTTCSPESGIDKNSLSQLLWHIHPRGSSAITALLLHDLRRSAR